MPGLLATMFVATGAMAADQGALEATTNNAANVNTPGYSRQVPILEETPPVVLGNLTIGTGVSLTRLESIRDPILQLRIQQESGQQGQLNASVGALNQAQTLFTAGASDIGAQISNLFSSIAQLSTDPSSISLRQGVLTAASNLTSTFNNTASNLAAQRSSLDLNVVQSVREVNTLTQQIAGLNGQITTLQNVGRDAGAFIDQRDVLINQLSGLIDVSEIKSDSGITLNFSRDRARLRQPKFLSCHSTRCLWGAAHFFARHRYHRHAEIRRYWRFDCRPGSENSCLAEQSGHPGFGSGNRVQ